MCIRDRCELYTRLIKKDASSHAHNARQRVMLTLRIKSASASRRQHIQASAVFNARSPWLGVLARCHSRLGGSTSKRELSLRSSNFFNLRFSRRLHAFIFKQVTHDIVAETPKRRRMVFLTVRTHVSAATRTCLLKLSTRFGGDYFFCGHSVYWYYAKFCRTPLWERR